MVRERGLSLRDLPAVLGNTLSQLRSFLRSSSNETKVSSPSLTYKHQYKNPIAGVFILVRQCDVRWNHIEASLILMYTKMRDLGFRFDGEKIIVPGEEMQNV